jgi:hypothetical protein
MKFHCIPPTERALWQPGIVAIEATATYPLGDDFFQIDHGADYFAFFDRLGEVDYYIGLAQNQVAVVGAGILRQVAFRQNADLESTWYLCDLKVDPQHQGKLASVQILMYAIGTGIQRCDRGYLISMDPGDGSPNRLVKILERLALVPLRRAATLNIYSLDAGLMGKVQPLIEKYRGEISYRSLAGIKDLRLQSDGQVLPLLHVEWGRGISDALVYPEVGFTHMFCAPSEDDLAIELTTMGILPDASASIVAHRMPDCDWRFVLTSDI